MVRRWGSGTLNMSYELGVPSQDDDGLTLETSNRQLRTQGIMGIAWARESEAAKLFMWQNVVNL